MITLSFVGSNSAFEEPRAAFMYEVGASSNVDIKNEKSKFSKSFLSVLKMTMFKGSNSSVENVLTIIEALKLRHNWNKTEASDVLDSLIFLAGPTFEKLEISKQI